MRRRCSVVTLLGVLVLAMPAHATGPTDRLKQYTEDARRAQSASPSDRPTAFVIFAVETMAQRALGRHWDARTAAERAEFIPLFGTLLDGVYVSQIGRYTGDRLQYTEEAIDGARATVHARVRAKPGEELPITLTMQQRDAEWVVDDIWIAGESLVETYRVQFDRIIRTASYPELVRRLKARRGAGQ